MTTQTTIYASLKGGSPARATIPWVTDDKTGKYAAYAFKWSEQRDAGGADSKIKRNTIDVV